MDALLDFFKTPLAQIWISQAMIAPPVFIIFRRQGFSGALALLLALPFIGFILCAGIMAFRPWPAKKPVQS